MIERLEACAIRGRLNALGMRLLPRPPLAPDDRLAFDERSWRVGTVSLLPRESFAATPACRELVSPVAARPRARLPVEPADFPFRAQTPEHRRGVTPNRVALRHALRRLRPRSRGRRRIRRREP